jgi:hypothetical protein
MECILNKHKGSNTYIPFIISSIAYKPQPKTKIELLHEYLDNMFIPKIDKEEILRIFQKSQRTYFGFSRLVQIYKSKNVKSTISIDLYLNEIPTTHRNAICIHANETNYWFMIGDICNHILAALTNSPYYFADPLPIKNPYTNIPFTNAQLYTIYFNVRTSTFLLPILFHNFFLCNFDLIKFRLDNEAEIRESFIRRHIYASEEPILHAEILIMLFHHRRRNKRIHPTIPKPDLIKIMRPYYYLYMVAKYHICGLEKVTVAKDVLYDKLEELFEFNPQFGRIYIKRRGQISYNLEHPKFGLNDAITSLSLSLAQSLS